MLFSYIKLIFNNVQFIVIILLFLTYSHYSIDAKIVNKKDITLLQKKSATDYHYIDESKFPSHHKKKILIFSYGTLVKQKANKKTGDILYTKPFEKTDIQVPISFTFLAGYPKKGYEIPKTVLEKFPNRRATATIDANSQEYKNLWMAISDFSLLSNARNNVAAREGAPLLSPKHGYDLSNIFYIKKLSSNRNKNLQEEYIPEFPNWVTLRPSLQHQQLSSALLHDIIKLLEEHNADAAVWVALPSNIESGSLFDLLQDSAFVANTNRYIHNMPPGNSMTNFENAVMQKSLP